ncbi:hypothetical protein [Saccharospirillum mangrovi]|uniref:hypothetical protein n=1 Tax=Saccharospirillum mangrovi TaxID=2161747 RepID=UPI000D387F9E|nr:hypothetical protein [Saccharospirillum mangrovi]
MLTSFIPTLDTVLQSDRTEAISQYQNTIGAEINWVALGFIGGGIVVAIIVLFGINSDQKRSIKKSQTVKKYKILRHDDDSRTDKLKDD